ncbi:MAG: tyrosine-type recombinase/integrase [Nitrospiria bacterium]
MVLIDKLFFPKISFKLTIEPRMKIYDRITSYIYELNQMVLRKEKTMMTFKSYENSLSKFRVWGNKMGYLSVNKEMIQKYKAFLISEQLLPSTVNLYLVALRKFLEFCADNNWIVENPAKSVSAVKQNRGIFKRDSLTIEEARRLLSVIKENGSKHNQEVHQSRDFAIIYLMLKTGLRGIEVVRALVGDIETREGVKILYVHGKGDLEKSRFVVLTDKVFNALDEYLKQRGFSNPDDPLFTREAYRPKKGALRHLTTRALEKMVNKYYLKAEIKTPTRPRPKLTLHSLRHTSAYLALDGGASVLSVQQMLRHADIRTTMIYVNQNNRIKQAAEFAVNQI